MEKDNLKEEDFDQELHEHFAFKIDSGQEPLRIDKFLMSRIEMLQEIKFKRLRKKDLLGLMKKLLNLVIR